MPLQGLSPSTLFTYHDKIPGAMYHLHIIRDIVNFDYRKCFRDDIWLYIEANDVNFEYTSCIFDLGYAYGQMLFQINHHFRSRCFEHLDGYHNSTLTFAYIVQLAITTCAEKCIEVNLCCWFTVSLPFISHTVCLETNSSILA